MEHMTENQTLIAADIQQRLQTLVNSINRNAPNGTICLWRSEWLGQPWRWLRN